MVHRETQAMHCIHNNIHKNIELGVFVCAIPTKFFTFANGHIINTLPVFRSIRLKNSKHNLGEPITHCSCSLRFTIICGTTEVKAFGDKGFVLNESIEVVSLLKIIFPKKRRLTMAIILLKECGLYIKMHLVVS